MYNNSSDHELERNTILNRSGNSFKRTKIQLRKALSECDDTLPYDPSGMHHAQQTQQQHRNSIRETNFHSPIKKKTKNSVAFTQPLLQQSPQIANHPHILHTPMDDFKKFNTIKTPDYLLAQQQRIKEYSNGRNNTDVSYSDTYSSSSSDYRAVGVVKPQTSQSTMSGGGKLHGSKNSLLTRKSTQSLCSCDAETELIPDPLRPLYQYSLDRKKTRHTYTCEQNAQILLRLEKEHQKKYGSAGRLEMVNNDMIPHAPPPPLGRKLSFNAHLPSYSNSINRQQQHVIHQQPISNNTKNVAFSKLNKRVETNGIGMQMNYPNSQQHQQQQQPHQLLNNKPDLFNFSSSTGQPATVTGGATVILPPAHQQKIDNNHKNNNSNKIVLNDDATDINMKPYPPFYFDDNHLPPPPHHCPSTANTGGLNKENELFFYHHEPANYIPNNYDQFGVTLQGPHSGKYNTIGSHHSINSKFHASGCNLHDTNLLTGHHYSTSLSNFNQQLPPHAYHQFHSGTLGLGYGGSSLIGGSFNSNGSLGEKRAPGMSWKHRSNCPSRNSSSSGTNSGKWDLPSRQWLAVTSILLITAAAGVAVPLALRVSAGAPLEERLEVATQLLESVPLIDGHNDLPWNIRKFLHNKLNDFLFDGDLKTIKPWSVSQWSHTDLQRMKKGRLSAQFWAAYAPCEAQFKDAVQITIEQIDVIKRLTEQYSPQLTPCTSALHITEAHKNHQICSLIGLEGGHTLGGSLGVLRVYYELGVRYMTLTSSSCHTTWADSHNADAPKYDVKHGGLTQYGKTIIREMNRLGMIIDLSKSAVSTMKDVLQLSEAPVIFSHSSAFELCNSSRNVQNEIIQMVAKKRGIIMVNFYSKFLTCSENSTVHDAVAHINHIKRIAGVDFVGLGAGFDGINMVPQGLEDISTYPMLFAELLGTGWTIEDLTKLAGENLLRVMTEVEQVRNTQKKDGVKPFEDIPPFRTEPDPFNCTTGS